jgi:GWxTD domain-containing protein
MKSKLLSIALIFLLLIIGCKVANKITYINLSRLYLPENRPSISGLRIFNATDSISKVFVRYNLNELIYKIPNGKTYRKANYSLSYELFSSYESDVVLDGNTFTLSDSLYPGQDFELVFDFNIRAKYPGNYLLQLKFSDLNNQTSTIYTENIYKGASNVAQNYLPVNESGEIIFNNWIKSNTRFKILCKDQNLERLYVKSNVGEFPMAPPPFSTASPQTYKYAMQYLFTIDVDSGTSKLLDFPATGLYHFQADTSNRYGLTLYRFYDDYPNVTETQQLIPPLRFLTTTKEYKKMLSSENPKQAVDEFWVEVAGNEERAVELIKNYYSRVEYSNWYFSSFKEGWKTDRGMIYIIFGPPQTVYRRSDIETWTYGEQGSRVSLTFDFIKAINPFTDEDYILRRQADFKNPWYVAVDYWRR